MRFIGRFSTQAAVGIGSMCSATRVGKPGTSRRLTPINQIITRQMVAEKLAAYLQHELSLKDLVAWMESSLMDGEFEPEHFTAIRDVIARLSVADVRAFGLTWDDCEELLKRLGYAAHVHIEAS